MGKVSKVETFDLYGLSFPNLEESRLAVERALGITLVPHESDYRGGDYYRLHDVGREHFILQCNLHPLEREWQEERHQDAPFLLYVNQTPRSEAIKNALEQVPGIRQLRHRII
jgi:hypothetical protein